jgi:hypothetical protein
MNQDELDNQLLRSLLVQPFLTLEERAAQVVAMHLWPIDLSKIDLARNALQLDAVQRHNQMAFELNDDRGYDQETLCKIFQHDGLWYIAHRGHTKIYTQLIGQTADVKQAIIWPKLHELWNRVGVEEGSRRRQGF